MQSRDRIRFKHEPGLPAFFADRRVLVTGATGLLGRWVVRYLEHYGACVEACDSTRDLRDPQTADNLLKPYAADKKAIVIHLAAHVGGIQYNRDHPADVFYDNAMMGLHVIHACAGYKLPVVVTGSVCAYPLDSPLPTSESALWQGYPEPSNGAYGVAKRMLHTLLDAYHTQTGLQSSYLLLANLYGPYDTFASARAHVIPDMLHKLVAARRLAQPSVTFWGDGTPTRDFLHVEDAALAVLRAAEHTGAPVPINIAGNEEISIAALANLLAGIVRYTGEIAFDGTSPNGQPRRSFSTARARELLGWQPRTSLREGLNDLYRWYREQGL